MMLLKRGYKTALYVMVFVTLAATQTARAAGINIFCNSNKLAWRDNAIELPKIELPKLVDGIIFTAITEAPTKMASGKNPENTAKCAAKQVKERVPGASMDASCAIDDESMCDDMRVGGTVFNGEQNLVNTGLLGMANTLESMLGQDPVPLKMAYYFNKKAEGVPLFGRALAQSAGSYNGPFLDTIYGLWTFTRDIAFGLMAVIMMVVGILIIMRKQVGPQTAVTIQMALPRVVIAMILITFSYVIGASGASLAFNIRGNVTNLLNQRGLYDGGVHKGTDEAGAWGTVGVLTAIGLAMGVFGGGAVVVAIVVGILLLMGIILYILVIFKMISVYLKILFNTLLAPVIFAIGAIPGQDETTVNWFKQMVSYIIAIPAMWLVVDITTAIAWKMIADAFSADLPGLGGWGIGFFGILIFPVVIYFGWNFARTVPDKIETAIVGEKKRR